MDIKKSIHAVEASETFKTWKGTHADGFLAHAFILLDKENEHLVQVGYYAPSNGKISTFIFDSSGKEELQLLPDLDVFATDKSIEQLAIDTVAVDAERALKVADECRVLQYPRELPLKTFFILQQYNGEATYNITFFTQSFKTINVKVSGVSGKVSEHSVQSLVEFDRPGAEKQLAEKVQKKREERAEKL